jgi:hypothetical protein
VTSADDVHDLYDGKSLDGWVVDGPTKRARPAGWCGRSRTGGSFASGRGSEWNTIEVECAGRRITVRLNGQTVLEADQSELADVKTRPAGVPAPKEGVRGTAEP